MSFGDRGGDITNQLIASGMPAKQAISLAGVIGQCMAKSVQRGAAEFYGPVKFSQPRSWMTELRLRVARESECPAMATGTLSLALALTEAREAVGQLAAGAAGT